MAKKKFEHEGKEHVATVIDSINAYSETHYGFITRLADEMTRLCKNKRTWSRQHISVLVTKTDSKRVEPSWSTGVLLERAFKNLTVTPQQIKDSLVASEGYHVN